MVYYEACPVCENEIIWGNDHAEDCEYNGKDRYTLTEMKEEADKEYRYQSYREREQ